MSTKDFSSKQEKMIADFLGWNVVSGSGARACHPGDIIGDEWLGECKTHVTTGQPIFFSSDVWSKICKEAISCHRNPILFADDGSQKIDNTWCIINHFLIDTDKWCCIPMQQKFKTNFTMYHTQLSKLYSVEDIINDVVDPICWLATIGKYTVAILPLRIFKFMLES